MVALCAGNAVTARNHVGRMAEVKVLVELRVKYFEYISFIGPVARIYPANSPQLAIIKLLTIGCLCADYLPIISAGSLASLAMFHSYLFIFMTDIIEIIINKYTC